MWSPHPTCGVFLGFSFSAPTRGSIKSKDTRLFSGIESPLLGKPPCPAAWPQFRGLQLGRFLCLFLVPKVRVIDPFCHCCCHLIPIMADPFCFLVRVFLWFTLYVRAVWWQLGVVCWFWGWLAEILVSSNPPKYLFSTPRTPNEKKYHYGMVGVCSKGMLQSSWIARAFCLRFICPKATMPTAFPGGSATNLLVEQFGNSVRLRKEHQPQPQATLLGCPKRRELSTFWLVHV